MLRGIAEIVTNHPVADLMEKSRAILKKANVEKKIFEKADEYKKLLIKYVKAWEAR